jgi:hypothetical protein
VGITERAARKIVAELLAEAYIEKEKVGRRNRYRLNTTLLFPHPGKRAVTVGELLGLLWGDRETMTKAQGESESTTHQSEDKAPEGEAKLKMERHNQAAS